MCPSFLCLWCGDVVLMQFYADAALSNSAGVMNVFQHALPQIEREIATVVDLSEADNGSEYEGPAEKKLFSPLSRSKASSTCF